MYFVQWNMFLGAVRVLCEDTNAQEVCSCVYGWGLWQHPGWRTARWWGQIFSQTVFIQICAFRMAVASCKRALPRSLGHGSLDIFQRNNHLQEKSMLVVGFAGLTRGRRFQLPEPRSIGVPLLLQLGFAFAPEKVKFIFCLWACAGKPNQPIRSIKSRCRSNGKRLWKLI